MAKQKELSVVKNEIATTPHSLLTQAIEQGVGIEHLEKLMELQERWEKKEADKAFKMAMSNFQGNKPELIKNAKVDYITKAGAKVKYNFISLSSIQKAIDPILSKYGLSYRWEQDDSEKAIKITCVVSHIDGHEERTYLKANADTSGNKNDIQSIGSTVQYLKRYTLEGALGLSSSEDNDGMDAKSPPPKKPFIKAERLSDAVKQVEKGKSAKEMEELIKHTYQMRDIDIQLLYTIEKNFIKKQEDEKTN